MKPPELERRKLKLETWQVALGVAGLIITIIVLAKPKAAPAAEPQAPAAPAPEVPTAYGPALAAEPSNSGLHLKIPEAPAPPATGEQTGRAGQHQEWQQVLEKWGQWGHHGPKPHEPPPRPPATTPTHWREGIGIHTLPGGQRIGV